MTPIPDESVFQDRAVAFCQEFLKETATRYVLGRGVYARSIADAIALNGFIDDESDDTEFRGVPVVRTQDVAPGALVVSASMLRPLTARAKLNAAGLRNLDYFAFAGFSGLPVKPVAHWADFRRDYQVNRDKYEHLRGLLDIESREVLDDIIAFRLTSNLDHMSRYRYAPDEQYFEDFVQFSGTDEVFYDVGSFDGATTREFVRRCPGYCHAVVFEPDPANLDLVSSNLARVERSTLIPAGLGSKDESLRFAAFEGSASRLSDKGALEINVRRLDGIELPFPPTYIKMDIEGAEASALVGARETIKKWRPRLAMAAYHRPTDLWQLPELILAEAPGYSLRLRHYTEGIDETVMYFLPV